MTAAIAERLRKARSGEHLNLPVKAGSRIYRGCMVMRAGSMTVAARAAATRAELDSFLVSGLAVDSAIGGEADGDVRVEIERGNVYRLANSAGADEITAADIGELCFVVDDQTVGKTVGGSGLRPIAGSVVDVEAGGVWVDFSDARSPRRLYLAFAINEIDTLAGTAAELASPVVGAISQLQTIVQKAVTTGGDVTVSVGATAVDGLACTIADAAAKGTIATDVPTVNHVTTLVAVGSRIQVTPAGAFAGAGAVSGVVEVTY